jgi:hypothetical protein
MDYRFTMTPRLIAIAVIGFIFLLFLLFALGFQLGHQWGADEVRRQAAVSTPTQRNFPVALPAIPAPPTLGIPASPITTAGPTPAPVAGPIGRPN